MAKPPETAAPAAPYQVVARRFRPKSFAEVVGQDEVLQSLRLALQQQRIPHALLFAGSRGVGKTTMARILARCLNCERGPTPEPCGTCELCRSILDGSNTDVIEIDAASYNGVDDVRSLREHLGYVSMRSRYRVLILDEAHMLSKGAFNALLKTLEEPPPRVVFVLATTEVRSIPETIRSRCQLLQFRRVGDDDIVRRLQMIAKADGVPIPDDVLADIALGSRGGMRDSETALERALSLAREVGSRFDLAYWRQSVQRLGIDRATEIVGDLIAGNARTALAFARELQDVGADERDALGDVIEVLRWLLLLLVDGEASGLVPASGALRTRLLALLRQCQPQQLEAMLQAGLVGRERLRRLEDRGVILELTLVRMAQAGTLPVLGELLAELRRGGLPAAAGLQASGPAPAAPAVPPVPVVAGAGGDLRAAVLARAQQHAPLLAASIAVLRLEGPDAQGRLLLHVDTDRKMHLDRLQAPVLQQQLAGWLQEAAGRQLQVEFRFPAAPGAAAGAPAVPSSAPKAAPASAQRVVARFGGRVVEVNPTDAVRSQPTATPPPDVEVPPPEEPDA